MSLYEKLVNPVILLILVAANILTVYFFYWRPNMQRQKKENARNNRFWSRLMRTTAPPGDSGASNTIDGFQFDEDKMFSYS
jgi:hypothetical protein